MKIRRTAAMVLSLMMAASAAGCASGSGSMSETANLNSEVQLQKGRYVEKLLDTDVLSKQDLPCELLQAGGKIYFSVPGENGFAQFASEGEGFVSAQETLDPSQEITPSKLQMLPDGRGAVIYYDMEALSSQFGAADEETEAAEEETADTTGGSEFSDDTMNGIDTGVRFKIITPERKLMDTDLDISEVSDFELTEDGSLYVTSINGRLYKVDLDTGKSKLIYEDAELSMHNIDMAGKYAVLSAISDDKVTVVDTETGEALDDTAALNEFWKDNIALQGMDSYSELQAYDICKGEEGTIYIVCTSGLYRYVLGGNKVEQLVDGSSTSLSLTDTLHPGPSSVIYEGNDSFLVNCAAGIVRYKYDPEAEETERTLMKIYSLEKSDKLTTAISTFRRANPDVEVKLEIGMKNGKTYEDAVKELFTEVVSDDAPDAIVLDRLDIDNLKEKGLLKDLTEYLPEITPSEGLIEGAALWNRQEDRLYSVAGSFAIPSVACDTGDLDRIHDLKDTADVAEKQQKDSGHSINLGCQSPRGFMKNIIESYGNEITDGKNSADAAKLHDFYESCGRLFGASEWSEDIAGDMESDDYFSSQTFSSLCLDDYHLAQGMLYNYPGHINCITSVRDHNDKAEYRYGGDDSVHAFKPELNVGICSKSDKTEEAKKFLKVMLSKENQNSYVDSLLPVNEASFKVNLEDREDFSAGSMIFSSTGEPVYLEFKNTDEAEEKELMDYIGRLDTAVVFDAQTEQKLIESGAKYICGDITLDEAVNEVTSFLSLRNKE